MNDANARTSESMALVETTKQGGDIEARSPRYRLLLSAENGFAVRNLYIPAESGFNLTRFDNPGEGPHPTCMFFDNLNVNEVFQQAFYGRRNASVKASPDGSRLRLEGELIPNRDGVSGNVAFTKEMLFDDEGYRVNVELDLSGVDEVRYVSVFWDVNDRWVRWMRDATGAFLPLKAGVGDSFGEGLRRSFHRFDEMSRSASGERREVFMEMGGEGEVVRITLMEPDAASEELRWGGMKFWDGPDDADEGPGVSHSCPNLDIVNLRLTGNEGYSKPERLAFSYRLDLIAALRYR